MLEAKLLVSSDHESAASTLPDSSLQYIHKIIYVDVCIHICLHIPTYVYIVCILYIYMYIHIYADLFISARVHVTHFAMRPSQPDLYGSPNLTPTFQPQTQTKRTSSQHSCNHDLVT